MELATTIPPLPFSTRPRRRARRNMSDGRNRCSGPVFDGSGTRPGGRSLSEQARKRRVGSRRRRRQKRRPPLPGCAEAAVHRRGRVAAVGASRRRCRVADVARHVCAGLRSSAGLGANKLLISFQAFAVNKRFSAKRGVGLPPTGWRLSFLSPPRDSKREIDGRRKRMAPRTVKCKVVSISICTHSEG
jgi:hypothetical protein